MPLNDTALNLLGTTLSTNAAFLALHTADPGTTGTSPAASARIASGWGAPAAGAFTASNKNFTGGAASGAVTHVGLWSASTGGTFYGGFALTGDTTFNAAGEYTLTTLTVDGN